MGTKSSVAAARPRVLLWRPFRRLNRAPIKCARLLFKTRELSERRGTTRPTEPHTSILEMALRQSRFRKRSSVLKLGHWRTRLLAADSIVAMCTQIPMEVLREMPPLPAGDFRRVDDTGN